MAKIWQISDGRSYVVNGDPGTTITYTNSTSNGTAAGKQAASIPAGATSVTFPSNGAEVEISSDTATIDQVFNAAAAGSGSSSGGSGSAGGVTFQVVDTLPSQGAAGVIYLVKVSETGDDKFEEWIWVDSAWESIGTTAVDPTTYAKLIGGNTFEGNQVINGDLTVTGDVSGVTESTYNVVETAETTITPTGGTWVRYTGTATSLTVVEPVWDGEAEISYLETAAPVDLQGVTWSPAKPILTGNGPFVYTLVHTGPGQMLAGAYGYSVATAEAVQAVVPIKWGTNLTFGNVIDNWTNTLAIGNGASSKHNGCIAIGHNSSAGYGALAIGTFSNATANASIGVGQYTQVATQAIALGNGSQAKGELAVSIGREAAGAAATAITIGAKFVETVDGQNVANYCQTQGTGSITIGAGANTLNTTTTVEGVETTVESSNSVTIGCKASNTGADSVVIGAQAKGRTASIAIGAAANGAGGIAIGADSIAVGTSIAIGKSSQITGSMYSITIGDSSTILGQRSTVIGYGATASAPNAVVMGAGASTTGADSIVMGAGASGSAAGGITIGSGQTNQGNGIAIGRNSTVSASNSIGIGYTTIANAFSATAIGANAEATGGGSVACGFQAKATKTHAVAIGKQAQANDVGVLVFSSVPEDSSTKTQLYFSGANTSLANEYYNGEAFMGYTVTDANNNVLACGTRRLSELFTDNTLNQAATIDEETGDYVMPTVFHPSDLDLPVEEPTEEPEDVTITIPEPVIPEQEPYTPLPVYPITEPEDAETDIPEPEPYTPLPVYPIVEPEIPTE